eukprot:INCI14628.1.p2 GENE.INCI14628.1~~INCI14628.1.p2  ORF type:complete len:329 (+),score=59.10 INCI14628.1:175-1161(+)
MKVASALVAAAGLATSSSSLVSASRRSGNPLLNTPLNIPTITIAPTVEMPMQGLGTWLYNDSVAEAAVTAALDMGYTHIDTALGYDNQGGIAKALKASSRPRDSYFITSKIPGGMNHSAATASLELALSQLDLDYVDLMLVHFPATWDGDGGKQMRLETWAALEDFVHAGKARAIGVSHYCISHIKDILEVNTLPIAVNQVQYHVGMGTALPNATDGIEFDWARGITYESFSPLCGPCDGSDKYELINGTLVTSIGKKYNKTGPQVALKWQVQKGIPVIPKTSNPAHMAENADLFSWTLSSEDMDTLTKAVKPPVAGDGPNSGDCEVL